LCTRDRGFSVRGTSIPGTAGTVQVDYSLPINFKMPGSVNPIEWGLPMALFQSYQIVIYGKLGAEMPQLRAQSGEGEKDSGWPELRPKPRTRPAQPETGRGGGTGEAATLQKTYCGCFRIS
jgi:hypothetical protein